MASSLESLFNRWKYDKSIAPQIEYWQIKEASQPQIAEFPDGMHPSLMTALGELGINYLYAHQLEAYQLLQAGNHVVIATGTASGKTICYNLPILNYSLQQPQATSLYLFPTKALANDQKNGLDRLISHVDSSLTKPLVSAMYDGDTPTSQRSAIRNNAKLIFSNPDMLHSGILPHHTLWAEYFENLRFVVIDELHTYRGVFGSHIANVIRRLKRIAHFYGSYPWFIMTSATIGNPQEHAQAIIEEPVSIVAQDGAPHGRRHFIIYNPPITHPQLGLRRAASAEAVLLSSDLIRSGLQTIIFTKTRRGVEITLRNLQDSLPTFKDRLRGYRSGYLPAERRSIEEGLRNGIIRCVTSTNALELGVDIGGMEAAVLIGYPGTIASTLQQAGRAGRGQESSAAILVTSANPLDQFLSKHPQYIVENSPEKAYINANNLLILLQHIKCASFELPFRPGDVFGSLDWNKLEEILKYLAETGFLAHSGARYFWITDKYPAEQVSLRTSGGGDIRLQVIENNKSRTIGQVDQPSASWMIHPGAIYLHEAQTFRVETLDFEQKKAVLTPVIEDYFTETRQNTEVEKISMEKSSDVIGGNTNFGEIMVTTQVIGYKKIAWLNREVIGTEELEMPPSQLRTTAFWLALSDQTVDHLREIEAWKSDVNDYGPQWNKLRSIVRQRDQYICQVCGAPEQTKNHHVHHKVPYKMFDSPDRANQLENLITLCPNCHRRAESVVRIRSGLSGLSYVLSQLAPLFLMCDINDLGVHSDPESILSDGRPTVVIYDRIPAGIGLSDTIYQIYLDLIQKSLEQVSLCECEDGCPSCVGPSAEGGGGGKQETLALLNILSGKSVVYNNGIVS